MEHAIIESQETSQGSGCTHQRMTLLGAVQTRDGSALLNTIDYLHVTQVPEATGETRILMRTMISDIHEEHRIPVGVDVTRARQVLQQQIAGRVRCALGHCENGKAQTNGSGKMHL